MSNPNQECPQYPNSIMLTARDVKASVAFYRDVLGFNLQEAWPDKENPMWANLILDKQSIMVGGMPEPESAHEMGCGAEDIDYMRKCKSQFESNAPGVGVAFYIMVPDVDKHYADVKKRGGKPHNEPKTQFYGLRDYRIQDPTGYTLQMYSPVTLSSCQSCAMPLQDAQPGQMYCQYCVNPDGSLKSYEVVFEGTVSGYFMGMQKMKRADAEKAATAHLENQPAWAGRKFAKKG